MLEELNYELDVQIDDSALDVEWLQQADLMRKYSVHAAEMKRGMDEVKECLEMGKAKLEMEIRSTPDKYGLGKVTEAAIQSTIVLQEDYQILVKNYIDAKYEYDVASAAVRAIDQKKTTLENLVKLLAASYFAGPKSPRDLSKEWLDHEKRRRENVRVRISQRNGKEE